jgi:hypothetical protein
MIGHLQIHVVCSRALMSQYGKSGEGWLKFQHSLVQLCLILPSRWLSRFCTSIIMSFRFSVGDLVAGTELARRAITALRELQDSEKTLDSTIVLSFRALQARRISEL